MELDVNARQMLSDIADAAASVKGLADQLGEAGESADVLAVLLALSVQGSTVRELAAALYIALTDTGEEG